MKETVEDDTKVNLRTGKAQGKEESNRYSFRKRKSENKYDTTFLGRDGLSDSGDSFSDDEQDVNLNGKYDAIRQPNVLIENIEGVAGSDVFLFKTPKKKDQMHNKALESAKKAGNEKQSRPKSNEVDSPDTQNSLRKSSRKSKPNKKFIEETPQRARTQTKRQLAKRTESVFSSDDSSEESAESTDDGNDEDDNNTRASNLIEEYFLAHGSSKITTSDHTLASLDQPKLNQETLQEKLKSLPKKHEQEEKSLLKKYRSWFLKWEYLMENGYNMLLYGLGSKCDLLDEFREIYLTKFNCIVINGYFPNITIKQVLNSITEDILGNLKGFTSVTEQLDFIRDHYDSESSSDSDKLFLVVHSIDGSTLRRSEDQHVLSVLASLSNIHMLASVDHLNCSLLWDQTKSHLFSWLWFDVTNFKPYSKETSYENSLLVQHSGQLALSSLSHVFRSLTPNAQGIFMLLAKYQLEYKDPTVNYIGLSFQDYYQQCREAFLVNSDLTLRAQLTEFKDHKLIKVKKGIDGVEHLSIPLDDATLKEFVKYQDGDNV